MSYVRCGNDSDVLRHKGMGHKVPERAFHRLFEEKRIQDSALLSWFEDLEVEFTKTPI